MHFLKVLIQTLKMKTFLGTLSSLVSSVTEHLWIHGSFCSLDSHPRFFTNAKIHTTHRGKRPDFSFQISSEGDRKNTWTPLPDIIVLKSSPLSMSIQGTHYFWSHLSVFMALTPFSVYLRFLISSYPLMFQFSITACFYVMIYHSAEQSNFR